MANPIERKVTKEQVEFWLGSDNTLKEAIESLTLIANGDYGKIGSESETLLSDILACDEWKKSHPARLYPVLALKEGRKMRERNLTIVSKTN